MGSQTETKVMLAHRLRNIETKIPDFFNSEKMGERSWIIRSLAEEQYRYLVDPILRPQSTNFKVQEIENEKKKLEQLVQSVKSSNFEDVKTIFFTLKGQTQELIYWAVWLHHGVPIEDDAGKKRLCENFNLLRDIQKPFLNVKGQMLIEQALHFYEVQYAIEKQKNTIDILQQLVEKTSHAFSQFDAMRSLIQQLPHALQCSIYGDVYTFCSHRKDIDKWGEIATLLNPRILTEIKNPQKSGSNLLFQYLQEQKHVLDRLEQMKELEEFERMTLLYRQIDFNQRDAFLARVSPKVRGWIQDMKKTTERRDWLCSDPHHLYLWRGAHPKVDGTQFQLFAPHARQVKVVLTAYGKEEHCIPMERNQHGVWELFTSQAHPGRTYRYLIEDCHGHWTYRTDPYGFAVKQTSDVLESVVTDMEAYQWNDQQWMEKRAHTNPLTQPLSIYEIHVDSWRKDNGRTLNWSELAWQLVDYNKKCPFTHIKLYGVLDNKNDYSWGYQTDHFLATNHRLGDPDGFKFLIDLLHQHGIGVILDCPFAHFKHDHNGDRSRSLHELDGSNQVAAEHSPWGTLYFDYGKDETKRLISSSAFYFLESMHVDGFVFDALDPMIFRNGTTQQAAVDFVKEFNRISHEQYPGILTIAEYTGGGDHVTRSVHEGGLGFDMKLAIHQQWKMRNYFRTPYEQRSEHHYNKLMSNLNDLTKQERWLVSHYHDDAASGSSHNHSTISGSLPTNDSWRKFAEQRLFQAWNLLIPGGGHLFHMGDEIGQKRAWNERLQCSEGAVEWHLLNDEKEGHLHRGLLDCVGDLHRLYRAKPAFWKHGQWGYQPISDDANNNMVAFHRLDFEGGRLALFFNFSPIGYKEYDFPLPDVSQDQELFWIKGAREIFNSDGVQYGGTGTFQNRWAYIVRNEQGIPTHFRIAIPPFSVVVFEEVWE